MEQHSTYYDCTECGTAHPTAMGAEQCAKSHADERAISSAAYDLRDTISLKLGDLADAILDRPAAGTPEWEREQRGRQQLEPWALARIREWHLTKIAIAVEARLDPTGDVINARSWGATWQAIADRTGTTKQAAYDRWHDVIKGAEEVAQ